MKSLTQHINESVEVQAVNEAAKSLSKKVVKGKLVSVYRNPAYERTRTSIDKIDDKLSRLNTERERIFYEMENDQDVEIEGGNVSDSYGARINKIDDEIAKLEKKLTVLYDVKPTIEKIERDATRFEILYAERQKTN